MIALALPQKAPWVSAQPTSVSTQLRGVSICLLGFTNLGPSQVLSGFIVPATNQTIFGPRLQSFPGPTNFTTRLPGGECAIFQYTNSSTNTTLCAVRSLEYKTEGGWKTLPVWDLIQVRPCSTALQRIPVNTTNVAWRIKVLCIEQSTGLRRTIERGQELGKEVITGQKMETWNGRKYFKTSS